MRPPMYLLLGVVILEALLWQLPGAGVAQVPAAVAGAVLLALTVALLMAAYDHCVRALPLISDLAYGLALCWILLRQGAYLTDAGTRALFLGDSLSLVYTLTMVVALPLGLMAMPIITLGSKWGWRWRG